MSRAAVRIGPFVERGPTGSFGERAPTSIFSRSNDMPNEQNVSLMKAVTEETRGGPLARTYLVARVIAIAAALAGAVPTAMNLYHSWQYNIPFTEVSHRLAQSQLWAKNFDCKVDYRALTTTGGTRVDVGACPKNGDISLKISTPNGQSTYEWIAFDNLQRPAKSRSASLSVLGLLVGEAQAADPKAPVGPSAPLTGAATVNSPPPALTGPPAAARTQVAQAMQVVCTALQGKTQIIRIVNEGGKCYRETFSPVAGKVEKREEVPCNTQCPR
jgi:hypothetical protein